MALNKINNHCRIPKSIFSFQCYLCEFSLLGFAFSMASTHCLWGKITNCNNIAMIQLSAQSTGFIWDPRGRWKGTHYEHETGGGG